MLNAPAPVRSTKATPLPEITLVPINAMLLRSNKVVPFSPDTLGDFGTGSFSPVQVDWLIRRKLASRIKQSAGMTDPGERITMSPGTRSFSATVLLLVSLGVESF